MTGWNSRKELRIQRLGRCQGKLARKKTLSGSKEKSREICRNHHYDRWSDILYWLPRNTNSSGTQQLISQTGVLGFVLIKWPEAPSWQILRSDLILKHKRWIQWSAKRGRKKPDPIWKGSVHDLCQNCNQKSFLSMNRDLECFVPWNGPHHIFQNGIKPTSRETVEEGFHQTQFYSHMMDKSSHSYCSGVTWPSKKWEIFWMASVNVTQHPRVNL